MHNFFSEYTSEKLIDDIFSTEEFKSVAQGIIVGLFYTAGASITIGLLSLESVLPTITLVSAIYAVWSALRANKPEEEGADSDKKKRSHCCREKYLRKIFSCCY